MDYHYTWRAYLTKQILPDERLKLQTDVFLIYFIYTRNVIRLFFSRAWCCSLASSACLPHATHHQPCLPHVWSWWMHYWQWSWYTKTLLHLHILSYTHLHSSKNITGINHLGFTILTQFLYKHAHTNSVSYTAAHTSSVSHTLTHTDSS